MSYAELARALTAPAQTGPGERGERAWLQVHPDSHTITVAGQPNFVWVRTELGRERGLSQAFNQFGVKLLPDLPVRVERQNGVLCVIGYDTQSIIASFSGASFAGGGIDQGALDPVQDRRIAPGLVHAYKDPSTGFGLAVAIEPFSYVYGGAGKRWGGGTLDLTSYVPAGANTVVWVKVGIDPADNTAVAVAGTAVMASAGLPSSALDAIPFSSYIPLAGVKLHSGATAINDEAVFLSCRPWWSGAGLTALDAVRHNLEATSAPGAGDDTADGYGAGSLWLDIVGETVYMCADATVGAAVWVDLTDTGASASSAFRYVLQPNASVGGSTGAWSFGANGWSLPVIAYDQSTEESAQWTMPLPATLPSGFTATLTLHWSTAGSSGDVVWRATTLTRANDETLDAAGTDDAFAADPVLAALDEHVCSTTLTTTGWAAGELLMIRIARVAADGGDTLAADAYLLNAILEIE